MVWKGKNISFINCEFYYYLVKFENYNTDILIVFLQIIKNVSTKKYIFKKFFKLTKYHKKGHNEPKQN